MKRLFAICLVASMLALPFSGCGEKEEGGGGNGDAAAGEGEGGDE